MALYSYLMTWLVCYYVHGKDSILSSTIKIRFFISLFPLIYGILAYALDFWLRVEFEDAQC